VFCLFLYGEIEAKNASEGAWQARLGGRKALMALRVIATTGEIGSGKDTLAAAIASKLRTPVLNISDAVRLEAKKHGVSTERDPLTTFSAQMLNSHGESYFVNAMIQMIKDRGEPVAVVSGIRTPANVRDFRAEFGVNFSLIRVTIPDVKLRHKRITDRADPKDPTTEADLCRNDQQQIENFTLNQTLQLADLTFDNSGSISSLHSWVDEMLMCSAANDLNQGKAKE